MGYCVTGAEISSAFSTVWIMACGTPRTTRSSRRVIRQMTCSGNARAKTGCGTVAIVLRTGGLADSTRDATPQALRAGTANGFVFADYTPQALLRAAQRALAAFRDAATWRTLQRTGMTADFSWAAAAKKYVGLYERAMARSHDRARAG